MLKAVFIDMGHTLVDMDYFLRGEHYLADLKLIRSLGVDVDLESVKKAVDKTDDYLNKIYNGNSEKHKTGLFFFSMCKFLGLDVDMETAKKKDEEFFELWLKDRRLLPNANEILSYLKRKGYKLALITNANSCNAEKVINKFDLNKYFDLIVISENIGKEKSTGIPFAIALDALNLKSEEAIVVGDRVEEDVAGARLLGIKSVRIDHDNKESYDKDKEADYVIHDLIELKEIL